MGILHSTTRSLNSKHKDEEEEEEKEGQRQIHPDLQNHCRDSAERSPKLLILGISIYKAIKGLLRKVCSIFSLANLRKSADPLLPVQDPARTEPLLLQTPPISSPTTTFDDEESEYCEDDVGRVLWWDEEHCDHQHVVVSIPVNLTPLEKWEHARRHDLASPTRSHQMKYVTVSVPDLRDKNLLPIQNPAPNESFLVPTPLNNASILENAFGIDDEQTHVESDHDAAVFVGEISNHEIVEEEEEEEEEEEDMQIKSIVAVVGKRKIKHYKKQHKMLLVGEGDFSFSACLAVAFGSATNIIATSLNSKAFLEKNYGSALSNIAELRCRGSKVMHGVDATKIATHKLLAHLKFDRIVFNFPFAGFFRKLSPESRLRRHRRLVSLFLKNAKEMVSENGEIHISHKTNGVNAEFYLESIASSHGLRLIAAVKFKCGNYPGYNTKYGFGGDANFNCYPSRTFKFGLKL